MTQENRSDVSIHNVLKAIKQLLTEFFSPVTKAIKKFRKYLADRVLITDLISKLVISFGVVAMVGGLYLMIIGGNVSTQAGVNTVVFAADWIPGIPLSIKSLAGAGASALGLTCWVIGLDLLLVGLGIWVRHRLPRYIAISMFILAACFQFSDFFLNGIVGSPPSLVEALIDALFVYFLFFVFDSPKTVKVIPLKSSPILPK